MSKQPETLSGKRGGCCAAAHGWTGATEILKNMKTAQEWAWEHTIICANDPAVYGQLLPTPQMVNFLKRVQADALRHAAQLVHDMSRGTKSEDRAAAIDEARDLIADEAKTVSLSQTVTAQSNMNYPEQNRDKQP